MKKFISILLVVSMLIGFTCLTNVSSFAAAGETYGFQGATLNLGSTLTINYYAKAEAGYKVQFTMNGNVRTVNGVYDSQMGLYKFAFTGINPQCMNDIVDAVLLDGNGATVDTYSGYSVRTYCNNMAKKTAEELKLTDVQHYSMLRLLADTLNYGAQAQIYRDYKADDLVNNESWVNENQSTFKVPEGVVKLSGNTDNDGKIKSAGLSISNVNNVYFRLILNSDDVVVTLDDVVIERNQLTKDSDGTYILYTDDLTATEFDKIFTVSLIKAGVEISTIQYNVKAFIKSKHSSTSVGNIVKALSSYGDSAIRYVKAMQNDYDLDFDINIGDNLTDNLIPELASSFDDAATLNGTGWNVPVGWDTSMSLVDDNRGGKALSFTIGQSYSSPILNIAPYVKPGKYAISFRYKVVGESSFSTIIRVNTNTALNGTDKTVDWVGNNVWGKYNGTFVISETEVYNTLDFCFHNLFGTGSVCIDDVTLKYVAPEKETVVTDAETWLKEEMTFIASNPAVDPLNTQTLDVVFTNGHTSFTMPGFWDGDNVWRVRFALPSEGTWRYTTVFSDTTDAGVHNKEGVINVTKYSGDLDIYKHGFVKTDSNARYFTYADGTPFFYLGDTHWTMFYEEFDSAGSKAGSIQTDSHFKYIVDKRVEQGFTVYQSEPIGAPFDLSNGLDAADIEGFKKADQYFEYIAQKGLVHANAQFFYADVMNKVIMVNYNQAQYETLLDTLSRYWIARFGAYPVMYTLAQEVDNDFYYQREQDGVVDNPNMTSSNNPWKYVCSSLYKYDPYKNPISAHQEVSTKYPSSNNETSASNSAFRNVTGHTWWATQWNAYLNDDFNYTVVKDYWNNSQGKPVISYEALYENLWTNGFGARAQGWLAFLNGMYGHGYGAIDIWAYNSSYTADITTNKHGVNITPQMKQEVWSTAVEFAASYQMGYMRNFFENYEWWNLIPAFDDTSLYSKTAKHFALATVGNDLYIAYIHDGIGNSARTTTGTLKKLDSSAQYTYQWFNPTSGEFYGTPQTVNKSGIYGTNFTIGSRPTAADWVLVVQKVK